MEIRQHSEAGVLIAETLNPRVDARSAAEFRQELGRMIDAGHELIALDLSSVEFIDSSGLGAIVSALKHLGGRGDLVITGARPTVATLFRLTRMDKVFRMFADSAEAVNALRK